MRIFLKFLHFFSIKSYAFIDKTYFDQDKHRDDLNKPDYQGDNINKFINDNNLSNEDVLLNCSELIKYGDAINLCSKCDGKKCLNDNVIHCQ